MRYVGRVLVSVTQLINSILGGYPDESTSSRAYRLRRNFFWGFAMNIIDKAFFWEDEHCKNAYLSEAAYRQMPPEFRK